MSIALLDGVASDLRYAARTLRRAPVFMVAAVLCLAVGIGANTTMFGVVDTLLLRPPAHVADPGGVVKLWVSQHFAGLGPQISCPLRPCAADLGGAGNRVAARACPTRES